MRRDRRKFPRYRKRAEVRFWVYGDPTPRRGFTKDISGCGLFIETNQAFPRGTFLRMEIGRGKSTRIFECVVARRVQVAAGLRALGRTGMGVRFLTPDELVRDIIDTLPGPPVALQDKEETQPQPELQASDTPQRNSDTPQRNQQGNVYPLHFETADEFLQFWTGEITSGTFVLDNAQLVPHDGQIIIEIHPPGADRPVRARARVVEGDGSGAADPGTEKPDLQVSITNLGEVLRQLKTHVSRLQD